MGAWGVGPFENDAAMDFLGDMATAPSDSVKEQFVDAMSTALARDRVVEREEMEIALAAACFVAVQLEDEIPIPRSVRRYAERLHLELDSDLIDLASRVLDRAFVSRNNKFYDIWGEDISEVREGVERFKVAIDLEGA